MIQVVYLTFRHDGFEPTVHSAKTRSTGAEHAELAGVHKIRSNDGSNKANSGLWRMSDSGVVDGKSNEA